MSSSIKLGLLTLVSSVAAYPHYGHHSRFHKPSGGYGSQGPNVPYPTGGWHYNNTASPSGTGVPAPQEEPTTTILETVYSTATIVSTIYATKVQGEGAYESVGPEEFPTEAGNCGPATVYVTETNKVTVTVPASKAPLSEFPEYSVATTIPISSAAASSTAAEVPTSDVPVSSSTAEAPSYEVPESYVLVSSVEIPNKGVSSVSEFTPATPTPTPTPESQPETSAVPASSVVESEPIPSETSTPVYSGGKRGLAYNDEALCSAFGNGKFSFAYNWASVGGDSLPEGVKYVPMMHRPSEATPEQWLQNVDKAVAAGTDTVMGFNEPDHLDQANLSPDAACSKWKEYMNPIASSHPDVTILGPSVTNGGGEMGLTWLDNFNKICGSGATWHAANIHFYDIYDGAVERFKTHVEKAAAMFGKKVWVTEFGLNPGATSEQAADFLKQVMEYMDGSDVVQGYSYFMVGTGENQLNTAGGLSITGEVYNS